jgi:hypothetical protein
MSKTIWKVFCMEKEFPGLWQRWYKNQCVSVGWAGFRGYRLHGKTKNAKNWEICRKALKEMEKGDYIIAALPNNRIGRIGEIISKEINDDQWSPLVPKSKDYPHGEFGRRVIVRWDLSAGPLNPDLIIKLPEDCRFTGAELRLTICKVKSHAIDEFINLANDQSNWVGLFGKFKYEQALSDYIANYPHHLDDNLSPYPNSRVREKYYKDKTRSDVLLIDKDGTPVIVECKQNTPTDQDIKQLIKYMKNLQKELNMRPRGILVHGGSPKIHSAILKNVRKYHIDIVNYKLDVEFRKSIL